MASGWDATLTKITALVDPGTGAATTSDVTALESINLQASVLANCVNSSGGSAGTSTACGQLLSNPNSSFVALDSTTVPGFGAFGLAVSPDGGFLYVSNQTDYGVSAIQSDHGTLTWINNVMFPALNSIPAGIAVSPDGNFVAAIQFTNTFSVVQTSSAGVSFVNGGFSASTFKTSGSTIQNLVFSPDGRQLHVLDPGGGSIVSYTFSNGQPVMDSEQSVQAGNYPWAFALSPDGQYLYVCDLFDYTITVYASSAGTWTPINGTLEASSHATGTRPYAVAVSPDGKYVYVANSPVRGNGSISVFASDSGQLTPVGLPVATGGTLRAIAVSPDGQYLALSIATPIVGIYIYQVNGGQLTWLKSLTTSRSPRDLKFSPNGQYLYATVPGPLNAPQGYVLSYTTQRQDAEDTLSALLNLHSAPSVGASTVSSLLTSEPVFTPVPTSVLTTVAIP
jgi:DNA-binding beta-propeller fold protein YncE